jgi:hypothetical protein
MEAEEIKKKELNKALAIGEKSGMVDHFDAKSFLKKLKQKEA